MSVTIKRGNGGFTLIELLIVVAILGVVTAIAIPQFAAYRRKAFDASAQGDLKTLKAYLEAYYTDYASYPY